MVEDCIAAYELIRSRAREGVWVSVITRRPLGTRSCTVIGPVAVEDDV